MLDSFYPDLRYEQYVKIAQRTSGLPVILFTGEADNGDHVYGYWSRAEDFYLYKLPAEKKVTCRRTSEGHYKGSPSMISFYSWILKCVRDPKLFRDKGWMMEIN